MDHCTQFSNARGGTQAVCMPGTQPTCVFLDLQLSCGQGAVVGPPVRETGQTRSHGGTPRAGLPYLESD